MLNSALETGLVCTDVCYCKPQTNLYTVCTHLLVPYIVYMHYNYCYCEQDLSLQPAKEMTESEAIH